MAGMPNPVAESSDDRNKAVVDEARTVLNQAAQVLTPDLEPAFVYVLSPHPSGDISELPEGE